MDAETTDFQNFISELSGFQRYQWQNIPEFLSHSGTQMATRSYREC